MKQADDVDDFFVVPPMFLVNNDYFGRAAFVFASATLI